MCKRTEAEKKLLDLRLPVTFLSVLQKNIFDEVNNEIDEREGQTYYTGTR